MIKVIQIIDALHAGGAERLAVNYANGLSQLGIASHICATREEGDLKSTIGDDVGYLFLNRASTLDINAILKLKRYVKSNGIDIIHAHSSSFFIATLVKVLSPKVKLIWHDHYGNSEALEYRNTRVLRFCSRYFVYIFSVNLQLKTWSQKHLLCKKVDYIKNFPVLQHIQVNITNLKGIKGKRIICLANLREQKDHLMLLAAFKQVLQDHADWSLHCVGKDFKDEYSRTFFNKIEALNLSNSVYFYDSKPDVLNILNQCDIGVLSSQSEGLPLALLEYGLAKLPVVVTNVGSCGLLIDNPSLGLLVQKSDPQNFAKSIKQYITNEDYRLSCADNFSKKVSNIYSEERVLKDVTNIYKAII